MSDPTHLLDSNTLIFILADAASSSALRLGRCRPGSAVTSAIAYAEVMRGIGLRPEDQRLGERLFTRVPVLPFDAAAAATFARLPFRRGSFDRLIAAHALSLDLAVVTDNERHFADVPGLKVENWTHG